MCCAEQSEEVRRELREELLALNKRKKEDQLMNMLPLANRREVPWEVDS